MAASGKLIRNVDVASNAAIAVSKIAPGSANQILGMSGGVPTWLNGGLVKVAEAVGTGASGVIEFASIPATYRHLMLMVMGRTDGSPGVGAAAITMTFETSPTAGAYNYVLTRGNGATASAGTTDGVSGISIGSATGVTGSANVAGICFIYLFDYAQTTLYKSIIGQSLGVTTIGPTGFYSDMFSGLYESTAAIDRIRLTLSTGNWTTSSRVVLYGLPE